MKKRNRDEWPLDDGKESREQLEWAAGIIVDGAHGEPAKARALIRLYLLSAAMLGKRIGVTVDELRTTLEEEFGRLKNSA